ncbi:GerAB/ArcD/ProY family transporter [Bacillus cereus]|nr:GerAB/ArcD/ProY family transporter [Bacillus cereus]
MNQRLQIGCVFIITHLSLGFLQYPFLVYLLTNTGHWEVVLSQGLLHLILICIYFNGLKYFPNNDVTDIFLKIGRWVAIIVLIPFVFNMTALISLNMRSHTEAINTIFLPRTPSWSVLVLLFVLSVYTAIKGISTILRSSVIIFSLVILLGLFIIITSIVNIDFRNASPVSHVSTNFFLDINFFYFMGFSSFLFLGFVPSRSNNTFRFIFVTWACVMLFFLIFVYIPLFIFGQETVITFPQPVIVAIDTIDTNWFIFNRQTMFFGISLVGFTIIYNAVMLWMIGSIMKKLFKWQESKYWIIAFSLIAIIFSLSVPNQSMNGKYLLWSTGAHVFSMIIIPFSIFIYGVLLGRRVTKNEKKL